MPACHSQYQISSRDKVQVCLHQTRESLHFPHLNNLQGLTKTYDTSQPTQDLTINFVSGNAIPGLPHLQVFAATPTKTNNGQVSSINQDSGQFSLQVNFNQQQSAQQVTNQDPKVNIEELLNKLTLNTYIQNCIFLRQRSMS